MQQQTTYVYGEALHPRERYKDIRALLRDRVKKTPERVAYRFKVGKDRQDVKKTYGEFYEEICSVGEAFLARGLTDTSRILEGEHMRLHDALGVMGENAYSWMVIYTAYLFGLGVAVPIDKDLHLEEAVGLTNRAEVKIFAYTASHEKIAKEIAAETPTIHTLIDLEGDEEGTLQLGGRPVDVIPLKTLIAEGHALRRDGHKDYEALPIHPEDISGIFFTSGTTARAKGVMLSHQSVANCIFGGFSIIEPWGKTASLSILPLHHTFENTVGELALWQMGTTICFNDGLRYLMKNLAEWEIDIMFMVPLVLESIHKKLLQGLEKQGKTKLFNRMLKLSNGLRKVGIDLRRPLFKKVRSAIAPNLKTLLMGGAPLKPELQKFFWDIGFDVWNAYGLTECSPGIAAGNEKTMELGTVGVPAALSNFRISPDSVNNEGVAVGEVEVQSENVMLGYFRDPEATAAAFTEDGWLKTGDYGYLKDGNICLTGREKSMIVLENGKNVFPEELEDLLRGIPKVTDAMLWAELNSRGHTELCARLELDPEAIGELNAQEEALLSATLDKELKNINAKLPSYKAIRHFLWSPEPMIRTTTRKVKRRDEVQKIHDFLQKAGKTIREMSGHRLPATQTE